MATPDAELKVRIEAELGNFANTLKKGEKDLASFGARVDAGLKRSAQQAAQTGAVLSGSYTKATNQAAFATSNLSRVVQDAPFGFIGIQNNLNPLLESFGQLRKETGSNAGALKALISSLAGPAGLGLALAAVSAGLLLYQEYQRKSKKSTEDAKKSNEEYAESLGQIQRAQLQGAKVAADETTTLSLLYKQYTNGELTLSKRKEAYDQLQKLYPSYFGNIKFEQEASTKTKDAYDRLTTSILATARARAAGDLITKNSQRQLENEQKLIDLGIAATNAKQKADKALAASRGAGGELGQATATADLTAALKEQRDIQRQINNIVTDSVILRDKNLQLEKSVTEEIGKGGKITGGLGDDAKKTGKEIKTVADIFKALNIDLKQAEASVDGTFGDKAKERVSAFAKAIDELIAIGVKPTDGIIKGLQKKLLGAQLPNVAAASEKFGGVVVSNVQKGFENAGGVLPKELTDRTAARALTSPFQQLNDYIGVELFPKLQSGFENFFNDILEKGTFSFGALGSAILKTFTSVLASEATRGILSLLNPAQTTLQKGGKGLFGLVASVIGTGSKAAPLAGIAASTGGFLGTGAGLGATATTTAATGGLLLPILGGLAAGGLIASLFKKKKVEPQPSFSTSSNFTTSPVSNSGFDYGRVVFEISGVSLIGVLNRAGAKLQRFGP